MMEMRLRVAAHTASRHSPARRLRIVQHIEPLRALGVDVVERPPRIDKYAEVPSPMRRGLGRGGTAMWQAAKIAERFPFAMLHRGRIAWLEREIIPGHVTLEPRLGRRLVVDVDDAVWLSRGASESTVRIGRRADLVVAGSEEIAEFYASQRVARVVIVPTAVDTGRFRPAPPPAQFTIGWVGSRSNLRYLEAISRPLADVLRLHPDARLLVVSDAPPSLPDVPRRQLEFRPWSAPREPADVAGMSVGLMPLAADAWSQAKCAFKMLLYMASGVPAVVTPLGTAARILAAGAVGLAASHPHDWVTAIDEIHRGGDALRQRMGREGRRLALERFSLGVITPQLAAVFRSVD